MQWKTQTEELIKALTEAQTKMWSLCSDSIKTLAAAPVDKKWAESIEVTEKVLVSSLRAQATLSAAIIERLAAVEKMPEATLESTKSIQAIIENLVVTQEKLMATWFDVLKKMDPSSRVGKWTDPLHKMQDLAAKALDTQMDLLRVWTGSPAPARKKPRKKTTAGKKTTARKKSPAKKTASRKKTTRKTTSRKKAAARKVTRKKASP